MSSVVFSVEVSVSSVEVCVHMHMLCRGVCSV